MSFMDLIRDTNWIWKPEITASEKETPVFVLFRKSFSLENAPCSGILHISADSRYKLYVNGNLVEVGPSKGDREIWYLDTVDIMKWLKQGKNCIAVEVLHYPQENLKGNYSVFRTEHPGLYVKGNIEDENKSVVSVDADTSWKCKKHENRQIITESPLFAPLQVYESTSGTEELQGWNKTEYLDETWESAVVYKNFEMNAAAGPANLFPRNIPFMYRKKRKFARTLRVHEKDTEKSDWDLCLNDERDILIPANTVRTVEISAGEEMTGYLYLNLEEGKGTEIEIEQSESYWHKKEDGSYKKGDRTDFKNGVLNGFKDYYHVSGYGTEKKPECYEPFWLRTFRFIKLTIQTQDRPIRIKSFYYEETGYPLEVKTKVSVSDKTLHDVWDISERTLRRCMHESYEDCPFYEQLQYAMDTRTQILDTYQIAADDRLARKCMDDLKRSQRYDGLLNCCYPSVTPNVIPGFSIYYILMLHDHMMYFGDKKLIREHMTTVENILDFYDRNCDARGYVGKIGGLNVIDRYWSFIDWTRQWDDTTGVPPATLRGPITMESLLYILGLQKARELAEYINRQELAVEFEKRIRSVSEAVLKYCTGEDGMLQDGPGVEEYSQHTQVFGILTNLLTVKQGKENLLKTLQDRDSYAQCSVAMSYYLFRALEKTDLYEYTNECWNLWRNMVKDHLTTCVEDSVKGRSDCHAWGALALYELPGAILGVRPASPGYQTVRITPHTEYLDYASGEVITPKGMLQVRWKKEEDNILLDYNLPAGMKVIS